MCRCCIFLSKWSFQHYNFHQCHLFHDHHHDYDFEHAYDLTSRDGQKGGGGTVDSPTVVHQEGVNIRWNGCCLMRGLVGQDKSYFMLARARWRILARACAPALARACSRLRARARLRLRSRAPAGT